MSINPNIKFEDELQDQDNIVERTNGHRASNRIEYKNANISLSITSCFSVQFGLGEEARDEFVSTLSLYSIFKKCLAEFELISTIMAD